MGKPTRCPHLRPAGLLIMLRWAAIFFVLAIIAALLGFIGAASVFASIAKVLFGLFLVIFLALLILGLVAGRRVM